MREELERKLTLRCLPVSSSDLRLAAAFTEFCGQRTDSSDNKENRRDLSPARAEFR